MFSQLSRIGSYELEWRGCGTMSALWTPRGYWRNQAYQVPLAAEAHSAPAGARAKGHWALVSGGIKPHSG
jgi:hypothetical protein